MTSGNYILDCGEGAGPERLQNDVEKRLDPMTRERMDAIRVQSGWHCLEVGPGAGSMTKWLCERVGPDGRVVALDLSTKFISELRYEQLEIRGSDIVAHDLEESAFDLAYVRMTLTHIPEWEAVVAKMARALRPGGWILCIEPDTVTRQADGSVPAEMRDRFDEEEKESDADQARRSADSQMGRRILGLLRGLGFEDVSAEGRIYVTLGGTDAAAARRSGWAQQLSARGVSADEIERRLTFFDDPRFVEWSPAMVATWGRKPA